ncbi:TFIIH basal transcription factor complex helicase subunit [Nosema bombycis CQ1]|uniref:TFIIH basal transcription factor complex helicase subunit n=1 Tax=Nosema bombycis (strain CQ1 / CVCC 102059) TaxID=578461 RepID=R0KYA8_NOSB1|nr:TFIIH basal transcription factor complex helicase subunit [Nosema bombycis CQ1]|eukprot:EOB15207.1 TFIIH basal transcription factor complex helicase subunit [Nosema bombycis CQ1]
MRTQLNWIWKTKKNSLTTSFALRSETSVVRNYGNLIIELSKSGTDGIICFFAYYLVHGRDRKSLV